ncbi:hypothetical protein EJ05DRAFT_510155 [Pseudovirgaria hyperparasitica]|uniref:F-box domain-containing protein n=1 Tax=Pseudovirgaria hyperparasitica TaxID=470096 RepID=A0A6A6W9T3_9PEZI|nr:uncharacterized protein EJ05DRAFT_510155 [Pseudovirgaria hyperparasitica]KAF2759325.1 hypothetical protein EJ05DRAFT_510155 [Pseudovirgaria hyperparasitica]
MSPNLEHSILPSPASSRTSLHSSLSIPSIRCYSPVDHRSSHKTRPANSFGSIESGYSGTALLSPQLAESDSDTYDPQLDFSRDQWYEQVENHTRVLDDHRTLRPSYSKSRPKTPRVSWRHSLGLVPSSGRRVQRKRPLEVHCRSVTLPKFFTSLLAGSSSSSQSSSRASSAHSDRDTKTPTPQHRIIPTLNQSSSGSIDLLGNRPFTFSGPDFAQVSGSTSGASASIINLSSSSLLPLSAARSLSASPAYSLAGSSFELWSGETAIPKRNSVIDISSYLKHKPSDQVDRLRRKHRLSPRAEPVVLPIEILQQIYSSMSPQDFNSARHACRSWMLASLDQSLLMSALKRGGWASAIDKLCMKDVLTSHDGSFLGNQWNLSCLLARECALSHNWKGNGFSRGQEPKSVENKSNPSPWVVAATTDFADLASGYAAPQTSHSGGLIFTSSVCGKFALVGEGGMIYVYELHGRGLKPVTSVVCPRKVLAVSMDASADRYAIAALLDGRMGIVCELRIPKPLAEARTQDNGSSYLSPRHFPLLTQQSTPLCIENTELVPIDTINVESDQQSIELYDIGNEALGDQNMINRAWNLRLDSTPEATYSFIREKDSARTVPVETGVRNIYRHLCSEDDPPRSVAICPQRRCVAFGCAAGIELHWVDAVNGQDVSRWFPLTAESDFLYFLPPRSGVDSAKKLRLISSAAHPSQQRAIVRRFLSDRARGIFWMPCRRLHTPSSNLLNCDHFRAVPLSDGRHIMFTDPQSGMLVLGSDAPLGSPQKLLRKIYCLPPKHAAIRKIYTTAYDLTWGARIVVGYDDRIVLYTIPPDIMMLSNLEQSLESDVEGGNASIRGADIEGKIRVLRERLSYWPTDFTDRGSHTFSWPLYLPGTEIGKVTGLVELAMQSNPRLVIWAFGRDGWTVTWQLGTGAQRPSVEERTITRDGRVIESSPGTNTYGISYHAAAIDESADVGELQHERAVSYDGNVSTILSVDDGLVQDDELEFLEIPQAQARYSRRGDLWVDSDGDVWMRDV